MPSSYVGRFSTLTVVSRSKRSTREPGSGLRRRVSSRRPSYSPSRWMSHASIVAAISIFVPGLACLRRRA
ncbi:MAG: hypothetical protein QXU79_00645 [Candidatus Micrarchaeaceae archaeon]